MRRAYDAMHVSAIATGATALTVDIASNVQWMLDQTKSAYDTNVALVIVIGIGGALCLTAAFKSWREAQKPISVGLAVLWVACTAFSAAATLDRVAGQRDTKLEAARDAAIAKQENRQRSGNVDQMAIATLRRMADSAVAKKAEHCGTAAKYRRNSRHSRAVQARQDCEYWTRELTNSREAMQSAVARMSTPTPVKAVRIEDIDPLGKRIQAYTQGLVSAEAANLYIPALAPLSLILMASLLLSWGLNGRIERPEFELELTGRAAEEAKVERFVLAFSQQHGRAPSVQEVSGNLDLPYSKAQRMRKRVLEAA